MQIKIYIHRLWNIINTGIRIINMWQMMTLNPESTDKFIFVYKNYTLGSKITNKTRTVNEKNTPIVKIVAISTSSGSTQEQMAAMEYVVNMVNRVRQI